MDRERSISLCTLLSGSHSPHHTPPHPRQIDSVENELGCRPRDLCHVASGVVFSTTPAQPVDENEKLATTSGRHSARQFRHPRQLVPLLALQTAAPLREDSQGARGRRKTGRSGGRPQSAGGICSRPAETAVDVHLSASLLAMDNTMCVAPPHGAAGNPLDSPSPSATTQCGDQGQFAGAATAIIWPRCACEPGPREDEEGRGLPFGRGEVSPFGSRGGGC